MSIAPLLAYRMLNSNRIPPCGGSSPKSYEDKLSGWGLFWLLTLSVISVVATLWPSVIVFMIKQPYPVSLFVGMILSTIFGFCLLIWLCGDGIERLERTLGNRKKAQDKQSSETVYCHAAVALPENSASVIADASERDPYFVKGYKAGYIDGYQDSVDKQPHKFQHFRTERAKVRTKA